MPFNVHVAQVLMERFVRHFKHVQAIPVKTEAPAFQTIIHLVAFVVLNFLEIFVRIVITKSHLKKKDHVIQ